MSDVKRGQNAEAKTLRHGVWLEWVCKGQTRTPPKWRDPSTPKFWGTSYYAKRFDVEQGV